MRSLRSALMLAIALAVAACGGARRGPDESQPATTVRIQNQAFLDHNIYVVSDAGQRIRIGSVNGNSTAVLRIPQSMMFGITTLRFLADPVGSQRTPVSESIQVTPGDQVTLTIPPG